MVDAVKYIDEFSNVVAQSNSASDFCRALVHSDLTSSSTIGATLFSIDQQAHFNLVGGYGKVFQASGLSIWDDHPFGEAARSGALSVKKSETLDGLEAFAYCLPLLKGDNPIGLLALTIRDDESAPELSAPVLSTISKILGIWLDGLSFGIGAGPASSKTESTTGPESLTDRQLTVLRLMAEGKTNAEIAQELILSESTIRQETVRIYRALGVSARADASKRAKHLGIIERIAI